MKNLKEKIIFIKNYNNYIYFVKNDCKECFTTNEMECDNEITITTNVLLSYQYTEHIYKHFEIVILKPKNNIKLEKKHTLII